MDIDLLQPVLETESHFTLEDIPDPIQSVSVKNQSGENPQNVLRLLDIVQLQPLYLHVADPLAQLRSVWCGVSCVLSLWCLFQLGGGGVSHVTLHDMRQKYETHETSFMYKHTKYMSVDMSKSNFLKV